MLAGCNGGLSVTPFIGTVVQLTLSNATPVNHLELWTRNQSNDILRVDSAYTFPDPKDKSKTKTIYTVGLNIRQAITLDDPCMIDSKGNLLISPDAYTTTTIDGHTLTPEQQAQTVKNRIAQVTQGGVGTNQPLFAVLPYGCGSGFTCASVDQPAPTIAADAPAAERLAACKAYWDATPLAYTPNPAQLTAPIHGTAYGFVNYTTQVPTSGYDGVRLDSPTKLKDAVELWLSVETAAADMVDGNNSGPVYLEGKPTPGGVDVIHFDLTGPTASGAAALLVNLDDDSVTF